MIEGLHLAPEIQEALLFLPRTVKGRDPIREHHIRPIAAELEWRKQRRLWKSVSFNMDASIRAPEDGAASGASEGAAR